MKIIRGAGRAERVSVALRLVPEIFALSVSSTNTQTEAVSQAVFLSLYKSHISQD